MKSTEQLIGVAEVIVLNDLSYTEWQKLKFIIDTAFNKKQRELDETLKLSMHDIVTVTHAQFG